MLGEYTQIKHIQIDKEHALWYVTVLKCKNNLRFYDLLFPIFEVFQLFSVFYVPEFISFYMIVAE